MMSPLLLHMVIRFILRDLWGCRDNMRWWRFQTTALRHWVIYSSPLICELDMHREKVVSPCNDTRWACRAYSGPWTGATAEPWGNHMKILSSPGNCRCPQKVNRSFFRFQGSLSGLPSGLRSLDQEKKNLACNLHCDMWIFVGCCHSFNHSFISPGSIKSLLCEDTLRGAKLTSLNHTQTQGLYTELIVEMHCFIIFFNLLWLSDG